MCKVVKNAFGLENEWYKSWEGRIMHDRCYKKLENAQKRADEMNERSKTLHFYVTNAKGETIDDCINYGGNIEDKVRMFKEPLITQIKSLNEAINDNQRSNTDNAL